MKPHRYNFAAAFVEYAKGSALADIAQALAIPLRVLKARYHDEGWAQLVPTMAVAVSGSLSLDTAKRAQEAIQANRDKNMAIAVKLQEDLLDVVTQLREGTLTIERVFANGLRAEVEPGLRERADLVNYAKGVAEMSYRALGDIEQSKNKPVEGGVGGAQQITIILPPAVSAPRQIRAHDVEATIVTTDAPGGGLGASGDESDAPPSASDVETTG